MAARLVPRTLSRPVHGTLRRRRHHHVCPPADDRHGPVAGLEICGRCLGTGVVADRVCPRCGGTTVVRTNGN